MSRKTLATLGLVVILLVSIVGTVGAQSGTTATETPTSDAEETTTTYVHPITQILAAYFGRNAAKETTTATPTETPTDVATVDPSATVDPNATLTETPTADATATETAKTPEELAKEIEAYHEDGMGFGVLVKLYAMAEASQEKCAAAPTTTPDQSTTTSSDTTAPATDATVTTTACTPVTVDELVQQVKGGTGMGQLFKEYGKPALLGVGHVKHAQLEEETQETTVEDGDGTQPTVEPATTTKNNKHQKDTQDKQQKTNKKSSKK